RQRRAGLVFAALDLRLVPATFVLFVALRRDLVEQCRIATDAPDLLDHEGFDLPRRDRLRRALVPTALLGAGADVIAVTPAAPAAVRRRHGAVAGGATQQTLKQEALRAPHRSAALAAVALQQRLHLFPSGGVYQRGLL